VPVRLQLIGTVADGVCSWTWERERGKKRKTDCATGLKGNLPVCTEAARLVEPALDVLLQTHAAVGKPIEISRQNPLINLYVTHNCSFSFVQFACLILLAPKFEVFTTILRSRVRWRCVLSGVRHYLGASETSLRLEFEQLKATVCQMFPLIQYVTRSKRAGAFADDIVACISLKPSGADGRASA
jgi:hypothetical protein